MAPKIVKKGPFSYLQRCCGVETKVIEPAKRPPVAAPAPPPPEPTTPPLPVPSLLSREPLTTVQEHSEEPDVIDVDTGLAVSGIVIREAEKKVTLNSIILVISAIALATLLLNVD